MVYSSGWPKWPLFAGLQPASELALSFVTDDALDTLDEIQTCSASIDGIPIRQ